MDKNRLMGMLVASAALGVLATVSACGGEKAMETASVKCAGINSCAGKGECGASDGSHDCSGKNSCKGKGWVKASSAEECTSEGGQVL